MTIERKDITIRVLNVDQIDGLNLNNLKRYRHTVMSVRQKLHNSLCSECRGLDYNCRHLYKRPAFESEIKLIKTLDWLAARCNERYKEIR